MSSVPPALTEAARTLWNYHRLGQPLRPAHVVVGLGSYDLRVADHCAALWQQGLAPLIVFSGARGNWTAGLEGTEAAWFGARAAELGVPPGALVLEERSTNLGENVARLRETLERLDAPRGRLILVTKPNTERRALATAERVWPEAQWAVTSPDTRLEGPYAAGRGFADLVDEMVGDLERILRYPGLGYQTPQVVPEDVLEAFELLKREGFTQHLIKG